VTKASITGLEQYEYIDKVAGQARKREGVAPIRLTGETDRVYLNTQSSCIIHDPAAGRRIRIGKTGSNSTVLWNPWEKKAGQMADLGVDHWQKFVCVESGNIAENAICLAPGGEHRMEVSIESASE
jgi:D-hexose-6-phosphate mutarotase